MNDSKDWTTSHLSKILRSSYKNYRSCYGQCWDRHVEVLEQYFEANDFPEEKRKVALLTFLEEQDFIKLRHACYPNKPREKTYAEVCQLMRAIFDQKPLAIRQRHSFYNAEQQPNETVYNWFVRMKALSVDCKFGHQIEDILLNRFISGLRRSTVYERLCEGDVDTLTLEAALEIATTNESVTRDNFVEATDLNVYKPKRRGRTKRRKCREKTNVTGDGNRVIE